jgi:hypothetical protein
MHVQIRATVEVCIPVYVDVCFGEMAASKRDGFLFVDMHVLDNTVPGQVTAVRFGVVFSTTVVARTSIYLLQTYLLTYYATHRTHRIERIKRIERIEHNNMHDVCI